MTKLVWDAPAEKFYETGVDRGVLYIGGGSYPWNGLISVEEKFPGGEITPYYLDGIKYTQSMSTVEYEAVLEALSAPAAFAYCQGTLSLKAGLTVQQQPRKEFGLSFRTRVGSSLNPDLGYKIHLVYNAAASTPEGRKHTTINNNSEPIVMSWTISSVPIDISSVGGASPASHFVIDSTIVNPTKLANLENALYGSSSTSAYLPSFTELFTLL